MDFDVGIRHFLTRSGFYLPGESQRIDRLVEAFSHSYWSDNPQLFSSSDAVYSLAFATIMLNTDLHNPNIPANRKMKLEDFIRNNRGIDNGEDIDKVGHCVDR